MILASDFSFRNDPRSQHDADQQTQHDPWHQLDRGMIKRRAQPDYHDDESDRTPKPDTAIAVASLTEM